MIWFLLAQAASDEIEDIRPPISDPPTLWVVVLFAILLVLALLAYFLWPSPKPIIVRPPLPTEIARRRLEKAKARISTALKSPIFSEAL
jgi:hypothetical protein